MSLVNSRLADARTLYHGRGALHAAIAAPRPNGAAADSLSLSIAGFREERHTQVFPGFGSERICCGVGPDNAVIKRGPGRRFEFDDGFYKGCGPGVAECPSGAMRKAPEPG